MLSRKKHARFLLFAVVAAVCYYLSFSLFFVFFFFFVVLRRYSAFGVVVVVVVEVNRVTRPSNKQWLLINKLCLQNTSFSIVFPFVTFIIESN